MFEVDVKNVTEERRRGGGEEEEEGTSSGLGFWLEGMGAYCPILLAPLEGF